ncbi:MAG: hypothetical protein AB7G93_02940 [Bdellovibrionales bacterium]
MVRGCGQLLIAFWVTLGLAVGAASAMPIKVKRLKLRAGYQSAENGVLIPLDLKLKTLRFTKKDINEVCGSNMARQGQTLTYSCTFPIKSSKPYSKLQNLITPSSYDVAFGGAKLKVLVNVDVEKESRMVRAVTFTTAFDSTGVDFEVSKFNDDFYPVYAKVAHLVISEVLAKNPVQIEVLESR